MIRSETTCNICGAGIVFLPRGKGRPVPVDISSYSGELQVMPWHRVHFASCNLPISKVPLQVECPALLQTF